MHLPHPGVQQQVVRFDVSVDEAQLVDGVDGQDRLCDVELRGLFGQSVLLHQQGHHIAWQQSQKLELIAHNIFVLVYATEERFNEVSVLKTQYQQQKISRFTWTSERADNR